METSWRAEVDTAILTRMVLIQSSPVDNFVLVEVLEAEDNTGGVEDGPGLGEDVGVDVHHQVAAGRVLHHKADVALQHGCHLLQCLKEEKVKDPNLCLEAGEEIDEEGVSHRVCHFKDPLLSQQGLHFISCNDVALFQSLDSKVLASVLVPGQNKLL